MKGTVRLVPSVPEAFADLVAAEIAGATDRTTLVLSGGGTASQCYAALADRAVGDGLDWRGVDVFLGDVLGRQRLALERAQLACVIQGLRKRGARHADGHSATPHRVVRTARRRVRTDQVAPVAIGEQ